MPVTVFRWRSAKADEHKVLSCDVLSPLTKGWRSKRRLFNLTELLTEIQTEILTELLTEILTELLTEILTEILSELLRY